MANIIKFKILYFLVLTSFLFIPENTCADHVSEPYFGKVKDWKYKGVAITAYWHSAFDTPYLKKIIDYYEKIGVNAIELTPTWYQLSPSSTDIKPHCDKTISDEDLKYIINYVKKKKKLKVNLKPHIEPYADFVQEISKDEFNFFIKKAFLEDQKILKKCYRPSKKSISSFVLDMSNSEKENEKCRKIMEKIDPAFFWRARINPLNVNAWFISYKEFLKHYLDIAIETKVDLFTVGTELVSMTRPKYLSKWQTLMNELEIYTKNKNYDEIEFTYAAHENEIIGMHEPSYITYGEKFLGTDEPFIRESILDKEYSKDLKNELFKFWNLFDFVSITVYFKLGKFLNREVEEENIFLSKEARDGSEFCLSEKCLLRNWKLKIKELDDWRSKLNLNIPIVFGEIGYRSINYGHYKPYQHSGAMFNHLDNNKEIFNGKNQANAYSAAFHALADVEWLEGAFIWQEESKDPPVYVNIKNTSYSLIGKPAAAVALSAFTDNGMGQALPTVPSCLSISLGYLDRYDLDVGGGYTSSIKNKDTWYEWAKFRVRPFSFSLSSDIIQKIQLGLWISGTTGRGEVPFFDSNFRWNRILGGTTIKSCGKGISWDIDLGIGSMQEDCSARGDRYSADQKDRLYYLFSHAEWRPRDFGYQWLPEVTLDVEGIDVFDSEESRSWEGVSSSPDPYDHRRVESTLTLNIFDFSFLHNDLRLTPSVIIGYGREFGEDHFIKGGIGVTFGLNKKSDTSDLFTITGNYRSSDEDQWEASVWLDILRLSKNFFQNKNIMNKCIKM